MLLGEIAGELKAKLLFACDDFDVNDIQIEAGFGADLLSDVLMFAKEKFVLLTGLTNIQVINTADMVEAKAIVFVRGKVPPGDVIERAKNIGLPLLSTEYTLYEACGILWSAGLKGLTTIEGMKNGK